MNEISASELDRGLQRLGHLQPSEDATRRALERVRRALALQGVRRFFVTRKTRVTRIAAAAAVLLIAAGLSAWLVHSSPVMAKFADVQAALKAARSMTCRQTIHVDGKADEVVRILVLGSGLWRAEEPNGNYTVMDTGKHKTLAVDPKKRQATLLQGANLPQIDLYERIKNLPNDTKARPLPGKKLDGKDVLGFAVKLFDQNVTVWADGKTRLPVRIGAEEKDDKGNLSRLVIEDFVFDKDLDPKLFSFEPPAGYKLEVQGIANLPALPADPKLTNLIVTPLVGIGPVKFGMSREDVEKLLGKADAIRAEGKNGYVTMNFGSRGIFLGVGKTLGVVTISCDSQATFAMRIRDFAGHTDKGIALGATLAEVIKAYGEPERKETNQGSTYVSYNKLQASFTFFGDKLVGMLFTKPRAGR